jgi:hypothetical protein
MNKKFVYQVGNNKKGIGNLFHVEVHCVIQFLWANCVSCIQVHSHLIKGSDGGLIQVSHVRKWCREFENGQKDITIMIIPSGTAHQVHV